MKFDWSVLKHKLSSRKFWAAIVGFAVAVGAGFGMPEIDAERVTLIVSGCAALAAYILGEGIADAGNRKNEE